VVFLLPVAFGVPHLVVSKGEVELELRFQVQQLMLVVE